MRTSYDLNNEIEEYGMDVFIEAEGKLERLRPFFNEYNSKYSPYINERTNGIIVLDNNANKWGLELRLYLHFRPSCVSSTRNKVYRSEYNFRINDVELIWEMFDLGYRIGNN